VALVPPFARAETSVESRHIVIALSDAASPAEQAAGDVLRARLSAHGGVSVDVGHASDTADLLILLGVIGRSPSLDGPSLLHGVRLPGRDGYFPEGYAAKLVRLASGPAILAVAADERGVLYAAGEIYRRARPTPGGVRFDAFDVSTAPAYRFRGFSPSQGGSMMKHTGARPWTPENHQERLFDAILAGANTFYAGRYEDDYYRQLKSLSLMTVTDARPNRFYGAFPDAWRAGEREAWEGDTWVCPSIPEARAALMEQWREDFAKRPAHDIMRFYSGDPGGCKDERCEPWGDTFVKFCAEMAALWHAVHPDSKILVANQDLDNEGDQLIFDYLQAEPRDWLYALCYAPGTNAMSPYFRSELREDLFAYPGDGPVNRYLAHTLHQLPPAQKIVHFSDITHWISAQYMVEKPDVYLMKSYGRRTFHARPRAFYTIFHQIMPFSEGDIIYSEGHHDEFHQYMWARLLWNPAMELDALLEEYTTLYFGAEAAGPMAEALLQLEVNLETPLAENEGIQRYADLVDAAGKAMPDPQRSSNYRWLLHKQKSLLDRYIQLRLRRELDLEGRVRAVLQAVLAGNGPDDWAGAIRPLFAEARETPEMVALREEAVEIGDRSNELFGIRNIGLSRVGQELRDITGLEKAVTMAIAAPEAERGPLLKRAIEISEKPADRGMIFW